MPLGRDGRPKSLRRFRVRPAGTLKDEHEQVLALVSQNFCRLFAVDMSTYVRTEVDIVMSPVQQWSWDDLLNALPEPYCAARLTMPPMAGTGLISIDVPLAIAIVEKLLGGAGVAEERRSPSPKSNCPCSPSSTTEPPTTWRRRSRWLWRRGPSRLARKAGSS